MIPPQFTDRLQTKEVKEGEAVRFTIRVSGRPPPEVTWYREGSQIVSSADFEILQDGDLHTLYIPEVFYEDSGKYTVKAASKAGQAQCTAELIVEGRSIYSSAECIIIIIVIIFIISVVRAKWNKCIGVDTRSPRLPNPKLS